MPRLGRADLLIQQSKLADAALACEAAIAAAPDSANALLKLAEIRCREKHFDESLKLLRKAQQLAPYTHPPKVLLAVYCFQSGEGDRARELLDEAHTDEPNHPVPLLFLGQLARQSQDLESARKHLTEAVTKPLPDNWPQSHRKRFLILLHSERLKLAEQLQDETLARDALANWLKVEPGNAMLQQLRQQLDAPAQP